MNAGPGRIPSFHNALLDHCRKFDVALEPYTFASRQNLLQKDGFNDGEPAKLGLIKHSLREHIEQILQSLDQDELEKFVSPEDMDAFRRMLDEFATIGFGQDRRGYLEGHTPGAWFNGDKMNPAFDLNDILKAEAWEPGLFNDMHVYWQASLMQPRGGMDRLWVNILTKPLPEEIGGSLIDKGLIKLNSPVVGIERSDTGLKIMWQQKGDRGNVTATQEDEFDFCISTMNPHHLGKAIGSGFDPQTKDQLALVPSTPACKVGWQSRGRWFEDEYSIYGGISWIDDTRSENDTLMSQMWYPSQDFHTRNAVLTGAYNSGDAATWFAQLPFEERLARAAKGGAKLHGVSEETFKNDYVYYDRGLSVAWENAPYQIGGWANYRFEIREIQWEEGKPLWDVLVNQETAPLYLAGDWFSHVPGWQEGAIRTAIAAVAAIAQKCDPTQDYNDGLGGTCRYEKVFENDPQWSFPALQ